MNVLVTGGAGYVGSHVCKALKRAGHVPITYDNLTTGYESLVQYGPFVKGDIADYNNVLQSITEYKIEAIIHLAALSIVGESTRDPGSYYKNNVSGSLTLIEAAVAGKVKAFVFSSSAAVYGLPLSIPIEEEHPVAPINPYGASKAMIERMLEDFKKAHGIEFALLRYFNAAGADPDLEIGEMHDPETHLIPLCIKAVLGKLEYMEIFGTDYKTQDGTAVRDYIHVSDLASAHIQSLRVILEKNESLTLNLGSERGFSVQEIIESVEKISGKKIRVKKSKRRPGDPPVLIASARKARECLGWRPEYEQIDEIIQTSYEWEKKRMRKNSLSKI